MSIQPPPLSPARSKSLNRVHRATGISAGGVLLYLLVTGIPLQFSPELGLGSSTVKSDLILDWYNLQAPATVFFDNGVAQVGNQLYWRESPISEAPTLLGAVQLADLVVCATAAGIIVFAPGDPAQADVIPMLAPLTGIAEHEGQVYLRAGSQVLRMDASLLNVKPVDTPTRALIWREVAVLGEAAAAPYQRAFRHGMLPIERVIQDLHSGRFFGLVGVWVVNAASVLLLALAVTGLAIWWRSRRV